MSPHGRVGRSAHDNGVFCSQGGKMVDLLSMLENLTVEKRCTVWRSVFALAQMYVDQNQDIGHIADKLQQSLAVVAQ